MIRKATGQVRGNELILTRSFQASIDDVWTSVTSSDSTARWIGRWEGDAGPGKIVRLQMLHEKGHPWMNVLIESCESPRHLVVRTQDDSGEWRLELAPTQEELLAPNGSARHQEAPCTLSSVL